MSNRQSRKRQAEMSLARYEIYKGKGNKKPHPLTLGGRGRIYRDHRGTTTIYLCFMSRDLIRCSSLTCVKRERSIRINERKPKCSYSGGVPVHHLAQECH